MRLIDAVTRSNAERAWVNVMAPGDLTAPTYTPMDDT